MPWGGFSDIALKSAAFLTVKIPEPLLAEIEAAARQRRVSKSVIVRERIELGRQNGEASLWSRMEDLPIETDSVPGDLSSNPKHLEGYGASGAD